MSTGILSVKQLESILNHLPVDLTFIDENDIVRYFSHGKERIFVRTKAVIGRSVQNCHPPQSVHVVNQLLADFKAGVSRFKKSQAKSGYSLNKGKLHRYKSLVHNNWRFASITFLL